MNSPDRANRLDKETRRAETFFRSLFEGDSPTWSQVLFVENMYNYYKDGLFRVPRTALLMGDRYQPTFERQLDVCTWINFNAIGIFDNALIINLEYPSVRKEHGKRDMVAINFSGPNYKPVDRMSTDSEGRAKTKVKNVAGPGDMQAEWCLNKRIVVL